MKSIFDSLSFFILLFAMFLMFLSGYVLGTGQVKDDVFIKKVLTHSTDNDIILANPPTCRVK